MQNIVRAAGQAPLSTVTGVVYRTDGSVVINGVVTFDPRIPQTVSSGVLVQPLIVSATTDGEGDLQAITLTQGLFLQVLVSDNGVTYPPASGFVPYSATTTISQILGGTGATPGPGPGPGPGPSPGTAFPTSAPVWVWNAGTQAWTAMPTSAGLYGWSAAAQAWVLM